MRLIPWAALPVALACTDGSAVGLALVERDRAEPSWVLVGAGDIAVCDRRNDEATARLLDDIPGTVFTAGDNVYPNGSAWDFEHCYAPSWGRHRARTRPALGNHEYLNEGAAAYFRFFGDRAGEPGRGWYSYDLGPWHVVVLNSNTDMSSSSPQLAWLREDLARSRSRCTVAYWHHPRFSSAALHGPNPLILAAWDVLYGSGAEIVLAGHEHSYERFAPLTPTGRVDEERGIRQFVIGTGGAGLGAFGRIAPYSEARARVYGVLKLTLYEDGYDWRFISVSARRTLDSGSGSCH